ncbi:unnamed protein product [Anisakis simplex]|uniref:Uncharacterized protein n=1 Tax=Anisakis simplex TaxID=6269 RepID=A0A0M3JLK8_ANISI|nr:unnamed protein product [Anisakis simplex]
MQQPSFGLQQPSFGLQQPLFGMQQPPFGIGPMPHLPSINNCQGGCMPGTAATYGLTGGGLPPVQTQYSGYALPPYSGFGQSSVQQVQAPQSVQEVYASN